MNISSTTTEGDGIVSTRPVSTSTSLTSPTMIANPTNMEQYIQQQQLLIQQQREQIERLTARLNAAQIKAESRRSVSPPLLDPSSSNESKNNSPMKLKLSQPDPFVGDSKLIRQWVGVMDNYLQAVGNFGMTEREMNGIATYLKGSANDWYQA